MTLKCLFFFWFGVRFLYKKFLRSIYMTNKILRTVVIGSLTLLAFSNSAHADMKPYIEGSLGFSQLSNLKSTSLSSSTLDSLELPSNTKLNFDYDNDTALGVEIGLRNLGVKNLRLGFSYNRTKFDTESLTATASDTVTFSEGGTSYLTIDAGLGLTFSRDSLSLALGGNYSYLDDNGTTITGALSESLTVNNSDLDNEFVAEKNQLLDDFNKTIKLYMVNAYYDFNNASRFTPYVGAGFGIADVNKTKDKEFAYSFIAGGNYQVTENFYVGGKSTFTTINEPTLKMYGDSLKLDDVNLWRADIVLGYEF